MSASKYEFVQEDKARTIVLTNLESLLRGLIFHEPTQTWVRNPAANKIMRTEVREQIKKARDNPGEWVFFNGVEFRTRKV